MLFIESLPLELLFIEPDPLRVVPRFGYESVLDDPPGEVVAPRFWYESVVDDPLGEVDGFVICESVLPVLRLVFAGSTLTELSLRIVRLEPVPVPGVILPVPEFGVPSTGLTCSGSGLVVLLGVRLSCADAMPAPSARQVAAIAVLR